MVLKTLTKERRHNNPATSASILDGAAALVLVRSSTADKMGLSQEARIIVFTAYAYAPTLFTTAPVFAIRKLIAKVNWTVGNVDLFEVSKASAVVTMIA